MLIPPLTQPWLFPLPDNNTKIFLLVKLLLLQSHPWDMHHVILRGAQMVNRSLKPVTSAHLLLCDSDGIGWTHNKMGQKDWKESRGSWGPCHSVGCGENGRPGTKQLFFLSQGENLDLLEQLTLRKAGWGIEKNKFHVTWIELPDQVSAEGSHTWISSYMSLFFFNPILRFSGTCKWKAPKVLSDIPGK